MALDDKKMFEDCRRLNSSVRTVILKYEGRMLPINLRIDVEYREWNSANRTDTKIERMGSVRMLHMLADRPPVKRYSARPEMVRRPIKMVSRWSVPSTSTRIAELRRVRSPTRRSDTASDMIKCRNQRRSFIWNVSIFLWFLGLLMFQWFSHYCLVLRGRD